MVSDSIKELYKPSEVFLKRNQKKVDAINSIDLTEISDSALQDMAAELKGSALPAGELLEKAFAVVREAAYRIIGLRPFDSQLMAGIAMSSGNVSEMPTGEGKTLAALLPAFLHVCMGRHVHILTFNDYLAERDCSWMSPVFRFLGVTVAFITQGTKKNERITAYQADVLYATAREAGFDYLRDFLAESPDDCTDNPFDAAIFDEVDSILIDEARIPLVIAGDVPYSTNIHITADKAARLLHYGSDFELDKNNNTAALTVKGAEKTENLLGIENIYDEKSFAHLEAVQNAVKAHYLLKRDIDYIIRENKIELIDEFTGRIAENRQYPEGLHAAVETKEGIVSQTQGTIMSTINLQHFACLYKHLAGMTGTAVSAAREFKEVYKLGCVSIPPHKKCIRIDREDALYSSEREKFLAVARDIHTAHASGRPVLIGTHTVKDSEMLARILEADGIKCSVLNAKNDADEAIVIARAGMLGTVTVSTNMAGRGVDIKLGGEQGIEREKIKSLGGLYVIGTNRHDSVRIDNQLRGRAGRQGDPGESKFFISIRDDLMQRFALSELLPEGYLDTLPDDGEIADKRVKNEAKRIQRIAEGKSYDIREQLCRYNDIIEDQRKLISRKRRAVLLGETQNSIVRDKEPDFYYNTCNAAGYESAKLAERQLTLYYINRCWAEYLDYIEYIRQGVHLVTIGGKNPLEEFQHMAIEAFDQMQQEIEDNIISAFTTLPITHDGIDMNAAGLIGPSSTWTYLINESSAQFSNLPHMIRAVKSNIKNTAQKAGSFMDRITSFFKKTP